MRETREHFALQCARISMANSMNLVTQAIADHWYVHAHLVGNAWSSRRTADRPIWPIAPRASARRHHPHHARMQVVLDESY